MPLPMIQPTLSASVFLLVACLLALPSLADENQRKPNLILILADDLGYGDVGFLGSPEVLTPHLDRLALEGLSMTRMRANCTVCSPTRAALLTGVYADRAGVPGVIRTHADNSWGFLDPDRSTLPDRLGKLGYRTAIVGKWHLGLTSPNLPNQRGFDHFHGFLGDMMDDYVTHLRHGQNYMRLNEQTITPAGHATDLFTDWAIDFVRDASESEDDPFFLYLAYNAPHFPIQPPAEYLAEVNRRLPELDDKRAKNVAFVEHLDTSIGRFLTAIDEIGIGGNTIVAFTSDNGGSLSHSQNNDPWYGGKQEHFDGGLRVPCVVRFPGVIEPGSRSDEPALTFDLGATMLRYAGGRSGDGDDAVSLDGLFRGEAMPRDRPLYFVRREGGGRYGGLAYHAVIAGKWKLMRNDPFSPLMLFDLESDPSEQNNVANGNPGVVARLKKQLSLHVQRGGGVRWQ